MRYSECLVLQYLRPCQKNLRLVCARIGGQVSKPRVKHLSVLSLPSDGGSGVTADLALEDDILTRHGSDVLRRSDEIWLHCKVQRGN